MAVSLTPEQIRTFRETIYARHRANPRSFPWRETGDRCRILYDKDAESNAKTVRELADEGFFNMRKRMAIALGERRSAGMRAYPSARSKQAYKRSTSAAVSGSSS